MLTITQPHYLPLLLEAEIGPKLIGVALTLALIGIFWIKQVIRIDV